MNMFCFAVRLWSILFCFVIFFFVASLKSSHIKCMSARESSSASQKPFHTKYRTNFMPNHKSIYLTFSLFLTHSLSLSLCVLNQNIFWILFALHFFVLISSSLSLYLSFCYFWLLMDEKFVMQQSAEEEQE